MNFFLIPLTDAETPCRQNILPPKHIGINTLAKTHLCLNVVAKTSFLFYTQTNTKLYRKVKII